MTAVAIPMPYVAFQFFDVTGNVLANGTITTYFKGSQNNAPSYTTPDMTAENPNPVQLNSAGQAPIYLLSNAAYTFVAYDQFNNFQWENDYSPAAVTGYVSISGDDTITGQKIFTTAPGFGQGSSAEYSDTALDAVFGSGEQTVGGIELVGTHSANINFTSAVGTTDGMFSYNTQTDTFNLSIAGVVVAQFSNSAVNFPEANNITVGSSGNTFLTNASIIPVSQGGTGANNATAGLIALLPPLTNNTGNVLVVASGSSVAWANVAGATSIGANGSVTLSGATFKWGSIAYSGSGTSITVTFPAAFGTACRWAIVSASVSGFTAGISSFSTTQLVLATSALQGTPMTLYWQAIGS